MDISQTLAADSTQVNADDLIGGPVTVTVAGVRQGTAEQPVNIDLAEFPDKAYRPSKSMRRVIVAAWGSKTETYAGRQMVLYRDPDVRFGKELVGGIKIAALSHIDKPLKVSLTVSRGKKAPHVVEPLAAPAVTPSEPTVEQVAACDDPDVLREMWSRSGSERKAQIEARVAEIKAADEPEPQPELDAWEPTDDEGRRDE